MNELQNLFKKASKDLAQTNQLMNFYQSVKVANEDSFEFSKSRIITAYNFLFEEYNKEENIR